MFRVVKGDLFSEKTQPLCHCVSKDYEMGLGIATKFRLIFGKPSINVQIGQIAITKNPESGQIAINMVTKEKYWGKPTLNTLKACLQQVSQFCQENNIKSISMPRIGCGLDKLDWSQVELVIREILKDVNVTIYEL
jgi:O-acetyl-ADP-ribose deacetylase (regulator of RNase III)